MDFLAMGYEKDGFAFLTDGFELSKKFDEIFRFHSNYSFFSLKSSVFI